MEILRKDTTPSGVAIQFEQYEHGSLIIGAYPIAKNTSKSGLIRAGETFRLTLGFFDTPEEAEGVYNGLKSGKYSLTEDDIRYYYWNGKRDMFYMGIVSSEDS